MAVLLKSCPQLIHTYADSRYDDRSSRFPSWGKQGGSADGVLIDSRNRIVDVKSCVALAHELAIKGVSLIDTSTWSMITDKLQLAPREIDVERSVESKTCKGIARTIEG